MTRPPKRRALATLLLVLSLGLALPGSGRLAASEKGATGVSGDGYSLAGSMAPHALPQGSGYVLAAGGFPASPSAGAATFACHCFNLVFFDDFESGDLTAWNSP